MPTDNPMAGRVPIHLRKKGEEETIAKSATSYRPGKVHPMSYRTPDGRNVGCEQIRRYPNGTLDVKYVAHKIINLIHKAQDGGHLTSFEMALLSVILPDQFKLVDQSIAKTMAKISKEEKALVAIEVMRHVGEEKNWNAGRGGGSVPFRGTTRS
jgi:hypothetical protein